MKFIYIDPINRNLPTRIKIDDNRDTNYEAILIRLLSGTLDLYNVDLNNKKIKQRINYFLYTFEKNRMVSPGILERINPEFINDEIINNYLLRSRNKDFFKELVNELSCAIYFKHMNSHTTAFIHIYRFIEHMSITFPLFYSSISNNYYNSFGELKGFFDATKNSGALNFHKVFFQKLFDCNDRTIPYNNEIELDFSFLNENDFRGIKNSFITVINSEKNLKIDDFRFENKKVYFKFSYMHDLIITFRNRFFHYMPTQKHNLSTSYFISEIFFKVFNDFSLNWIGYLFGEITERRIEKLF